MATSRPVRRPPSACTAMRPRRPLSTSVCWVSARPISHGRAGMGQRGQRRGAGAALVAGDGDVVGAGLRDARGDRADAHLGHQLDRDARRRIDVLQVVDQLRQILDRIDVVVRRRRDQADAGRRVAHARRCAASTLCPGSWPPSPGLAPCAILICSSSALTRYSVGDAEAARGDLLDRRAHRIAVGQRLEAVALLAALAGVRLAADAVHRHGQRGVRLAADRAEAHRAGGEALDDLARRLDLVERRPAVGRLAAESSSRGWSSSAPALLIDARRRKSRILGGQVAAHRMLQVGDRRRRPGMRLAAARGRRRCRRRRACCVDRASP